MYNGNRLSPITLSGEDPVTKLIAHRFLSDAHLFNFQRSFFLQYSRFLSIPLPGMNHNSVGLRIGLRKFLFFSVFRNNLNDGEIKFLCKSKVSRVMGGNAHDCSRSMIRQNIVGNPDRYLFSIHGIHGIGSRKYACLILIRHRHSFHIGFIGCLLDILFHCRFLGRSGNLLYQRMFRCKNQEGCSEKRIRSRGKYGDLLFTVQQFKVYLRTIGTPYPLGLHLLDLFRPIQSIEII